MDFDFGGERRNDHVIAQQQETLARLDAAMSCVSTNYNTLKMHCSRCCFQQIGD